LFNNMRGIKKWITLLAFLLLGEAYAHGYGGKELNEFEHITYKFESIYPDIQTMNAVEKSINKKHSMNPLEGSRKGK